MCAAPSRPDSISLLATIHARSALAVQLADAEATAVEGLDAPAWLTADGSLVLHPSGVISKAWRRKKIGSIAAVDLDPNVAIGLNDLGSGSQFLESSILHAADDETIQAILDHQRHDRGPAICAQSLDRLKRWRPRSQRRLILDTTLGAKRAGMERLASDLASTELDGLRLHHSEWNGGFVTMVNRFGLLAIGWGCRHEREMRALLTMGIDIIASEHTAHLATPSLDTDG